MRQQAGEGESRAKRAQPRLRLHKVLEAGRARIFSVVAVVPRDTVR